MKMIMTGELDHKITCTIVIRAFNEAKHIGRLLTGIKQQTVKAVEIILVDSYSSDRTVEIAKQYPIRILRLQKHWPKSPAPWRYLGDIEIENL